jgi:hypothetical protein
MAPMLVEPGGPVARPEGTPKGVAKLPAQRSTAERATHPPPHAVVAHPMRRSRRFVKECAREMSVGPRFERGCPNSIRQFSR